MTDIVTRTIDYDCAGTPLQGYLASPGGGGGRRPAVLLVHEWSGVGEHVCERARQVAGELGYHGFAVDVYGRGIRPESVEDCSATMMIYVNDRELLCRRLQAALAWIRAQPDVDATRIAILGYCFGGLAALELARSGADLRLAASFHGNLSHRAPAARGAVRCPVVAFHGADDPLVTQDVVAAFQREMTDAGADWTVVQFGGAVHSFTNRAAADRGFGIEYHAAADRRSFAMLAQYLAEAFD